MCPIGRPGVSLIVHSPAKVNLHLEVLGRRPDGYHELRTLFAAVGLWDTLVLRAQAGEEITLEVSPAGVVSVGEDNLVVQAARALQRYARKPLGAHLVLHKRIPVASGLGGGSSDAAAALVGLNRLWEIGAELGELHSIAVRLGADVPFFLVGGAAWGQGRGNELQPLPDLPPWWVVLLPGEVGISTAQVYASLSAPPVGVTPPSPVYDWVRYGGKLPLAACRNDLEPAVMERFPEAAERLRALAGERALLTMLSGSGGTVYALFDGEESARACARRLAGRGALAVPILSRETSVLHPSEGEEPWRSPMYGST